MKKLFSISFFFILNLLCFGQEVSISLVDSISYPKNKFKKFLAVDNHNSLYFSNFEVITKIKENQNWVYANYELGVPTSVSVINPLQVLVFYKETNTIVLLDRFLNETQRVDLNQLTPPKIGWWIENTKNQEVWLYNGETNQLEFFNYKKNITLSQTIPFLETPIHLTSNFNNSYVLFQNKIDQYNIYGTIVHSISTENIEQIKINNSILIGKSGNQFQIFDTKLKPLGNFKIPKNNPADFSLRDEKLYIYCRSKLFIYNLALPENPYLEDFYNKMERWSFNLQIYFLNSRFRQILDIRKSGKTTIQDRSIYEDAYIFAPNLHSMGLMTSRDFDNYSSLFNLMEEVVEGPDLLIYLRSSIPNLVKQIHKRGREYESSISIDYLSKLNDRYEDWVTNYSKGKLLIINVDELDFIDNPEDLGTVINKIDAELNGLF